LSSFLNPKGSRKKRSFFGGPGTKRSGWGKKNPTKMWPLSSRDFCAASLILPGDTYCGEKIHVKTLDANPGEYDHDSDPYTNKHRSGTKCQERSGSGFNPLKGN